MTGAQAVVALAVLLIGAVYVGAYLLCTSVLIPWSRKLVARSDRERGRAGAGVQRRSSVRLVRGSEPAE